MKIIYLHQYFNTPNMSGGTRSYEMARRLVKKGHEVHMVTSWRQKDGRKDWFQTNEAGINVYWLPVSYSNCMGFYKRMKAFLAFAYGAARKAITLGGDIVFATSTPLTIALPAVYASKKLKVPMVFEVRDLWPELPIAIGAIRNPILKWFARKLEQHSYRNATRVVALSPGMRDGVSKAGYDFNCIDVIPNSCDMELFTVDSIVGTKWRKDKEWLQDRPLILYAGAMGLINDLGYFVRLARETLDKDSEIRFLIVGEGKEREKVESMARKLGVLNNNLFIMGPCPKHEIPTIFSAATITSNICINMKEVWHNSANKFFDGLASGKPVLINFNGWQADLLKKSGAGLVLDPVDVGKSAILLVRKIRDKSWLADASSSARRLAVDSFCRDKLGDQLENVLLKARAEYNKKRLR